MLLDVRRRQVYHINYHDTSASLKVRHNPFGRVAARFHSLFLDSGSKLGFVSRAIPLRIDSDLPCQVATIREQDVRQIPFRMLDKVKRFLDLQMKVPHIVEL